MALKRGKPGGDEPLEEVVGTVERVTFHSEESGFCVLRVKVKGKRELETIIGSTPNVVPGETVQAKGAWIEDRDHGHMRAAAGLFQIEISRALPGESFIMESGHA